MAAIRKTKNPVENTARTFEKWAADYQRVADGVKYASQKAAIMREVAHYLDCAARLRGQPVQHSGVRVGRRRARY